MPIFEYECTKCGQRTEHLQLSSGAPLSACPECGGEVRKLMSAPAFQFKGSGWYVTDYAGKGKGGDGAKDKTEAPAEAGNSKEPKKSKDSDGSAGGTPKTSSASTTSPSD